MAGAAGASNGTAASLAARSHHGAGTGAGAGWVGAFVVLVLLTGCSSAASTAGGSAGSTAPATTAGGPQAVSPTTTARVELDQATLEIPVGAVASAGTVTARLSQAPAPDGIEPVGPALEAHLDGTTLVQPATVTWHLQPPGDLGGTAFAPFVVSVADNGDIEAVPSTWDASTNVLTAHPAHFSIQVPAWLNPKHVLTNIVNGMKSYLTGRANAAAPACDHEDQARADGTAARSSSGDLVKWCFGMDGTTRIAKLVNNRNAPVVVTYAKELKARDVEGSGISAESVGRWVSSLAPPTVPDAQIRVLGGGQTLTLEVPDGLPADAQLGADVEMDLLTWAFSGFDLAWSAVTDPAAGGVAAALKKSDVEREAFQDSVGMLDCLREHLTADMDLRGRAGQSPSFGDDAAKAAQIGLDCGLDFIVAYAKEQRPKTAISVVVSAFVGLIRDGVGMITAALRDAADMTTGDALYEFRLVTPKAPTPPPTNPPTRPAPETTTAPTTTVSCPNIGLEAGSDNAASSIRSTGVSCADASKLVRTVAAGHNFYSGPRAFSMGGYNCTVVTDDTGLPKGNYTCTAGSKRVTWTKT